MIRALTAERLAGMIAVTIDSEGIALEMGAEKDDVLPIISDQQIWAPEQLRLITSFETTLQIVLA